MLKRTKGRLLLTLLVTTGLAGTLNNSSLSQKERKQAISLIKSSRNEIVQSVSGLSPRQFNYRISAKEPSIAELIVSMTALEKTSSDEIKSVMEQPANSENRLKIEITDEQLLATDSYPLWKKSVPEENKVQAKDPEEALRKFMLLRNNHIRYIRTSTEDLRNHVALTSVGWIDCYQYYLLLADRTAWCAEMVKKIKSSKGFPKSKK
jgi:hypothetical protein